MVPSRYSLDAVARHLLEQFELRRPGLSAWTPALESSLRESAEAELRQMERQCRELGVDDAPYWQRARRVLDDVLLPRYRKIVEAELALQEKEYGIWRGGDLVARAVFALAGFVLGVIFYEVPYIPIYEKWFPALLLVAGPLFPEMVMAWYRFRYRKKLEALIDDLRKAGENLDAYRPLSELTSALGANADLLEAPATPADAGAPRKGRERS